MKKFFLFTLIIFLLCVNHSYALMVGDAPNPYGSATHDTAEWQMIGSSNLVDDGVWWSTDGGTSWGNDSVNVGDKIQFKFELWHAGYGNHLYDQLKAWVDWDQNGNWDNSSEVIIAIQSFKNKNAIHNDVYASDSLLAYWNNNYAYTDYYFTGPFEITDDMKDGLWLRARSQCDHVPYDTMTPYGNLWQGEVEDWKITVNPVPEPATMLLLGSGLVGLAGFRKKFKKA